MKSLFVILLALCTACPVAADPVASCSRDDQSRNNINVQGERFTVQVEGKGPDIILIPGLGSPRDVWDDTVTALVGCYTVHTIQVRGFGDDAGPNAAGPVLEPLIAELAGYIDTAIVGRGGKPPILIGHSMGGLAALELAHAHPKLVTRLMMIDSLPSFAAAIPGLANADAATIEKIATQFRDRIAASHGKPTDPAAIEASVAGMALKPDMLAIVRKWSAAADARVVAQVAYEDLVTDMRPKLAGVKAPITVLAAWHSGMPFTQPQVQAFFERQFSGTPTLSVATVPDSAHFIMLDQPKKFEAELMKFLADAG